MSGSGRNLGRRACWCRGNTETGRHGGQSRTGCPPSVEKTVAVHPRSREGQSSSASVGTLLCLTHLGTGAASAAVVDGVDPRLLPGPSGIPPSRQCAPPTHLQKDSPQLGEKSQRPCPSSLCPTRPENAPCASPICGG